MIFYLHGFNSSGQSAKGRYLAEQFADISFHRPSYPPVPDEAITYLANYLEQRIQVKQSTMIIGSSLGGYYAQYLSRQFQSCVVMINPALNPAVTLTPYIGLQQNYYTNEEYYFGEAELTRLLQYDVANPCLTPVPTLLLLDEADEIIDYRHAYELYRGCAERHCFPDGDHQFQHLAESVPLIRRFYQQHG
jgi:hypothetical protein